jgi:hypothetical protein
VDVAASEAEAEDWMHFAAHMQADSAAGTQEVSFSSSLASQQHSSQKTPREGATTGSMQQQQQCGVAEQAAAAGAGGASSQLLQRIESRGFSGLWRRSPSIKVRREQVSSIRSSLFVNFNTAAGNTMTSGGRGVL